MEGKELLEAEDRADSPSSRNEDQPPVAQPEASRGGQVLGPAALWDLLEKKFLEYQQLTYRSPEERRESLLSLLPLFLKVRIMLQNFGYYLTNNDCASLCGTVCCIFNFFSLFEGWEEGE